MAFINPRQPNIIKNLLSESLITSKDRAGDGGGGEEPSSPYLDGVIASTVFELDATDTNSYSGTGTAWNNLIASPADGESQAAYNTTLTNSAWTFTGTAGDQAAYWAHSTNGRFKISANTDFTNGLHKTTGGTSWWAAFVVEQPSVGQVRLAITAPNTGNGMFLQTTTGTGNTNFHVAANSFNSLPIISQTPTSQFSVLVYTFNPSTGDVGLWVNTTTGTFDTDTLTAVTADASTELGIGAYADTVGGSSSGSKIVSFAMGNEYIDDTKAGLIIGYLETKHGRDYTP